MDIYQWSKKYSEITNRYNALYRSAAAHFGFSESGFKILYRLYIARGAATQNRLAEELCLSKQTVNSAVLKLEKAGLIELSKGTAAKNSKFVSLTDKGLSECQHCIDKLIKAESSALEKMDDKQLRQFLELYELQYTILEKEIKRLLLEEE